MADSINILYIAKEDKNGKVLTEQQLQELQDLVQPLQFNFSGGTPGVKEANFYVSSFSSYVREGKDYWRVIVYQLPSDLESTNVAIKNSSVYTYTNWSASANMADIAVNAASWTRLDLTNKGGTWPSDDAWKVYGNIAEHGYKFSHTPNYSLQWVLEITASHEELFNKEVQFGLLTTGSYWADVNGAFGDGVCFPISQSEDNAYDPSTQSGGDIAKRWGFNNPGGSVEIPTSGLQIKISGSVRADAMVSESVWYPVVASTTPAPGSNFTITNLECTMSLELDNKAQGFQTASPIIVNPSDQKLVLILAESAVDGNGNSLSNGEPFQYSEYDVLMNNALTGRPNPFLQEVDYNQQPGGTVSSRLFASSSIDVPSAADQGFMTGFTKGGVGGSNLDVITLEGVDLTSVTGNGTGGKVDITLLNLGGVLQFATDITVSDPSNASNGYIELETVQCTNAAMNAVSDTTGTGGLNNMIIQRFNLFGFPPEVPVNITQIQSGSAALASVPESNYTSLASINPRYDGCELKSVDYNFFTPQPSQSKGGVGLRYPKGIKSPLLKNSLLKKNVVEFLDGNTGSWDGDVSYGNTSCTDHRPIYFAHFETSHADPTYYGTTTFAIDSLIAVPTGSITKFNSPTTEIIDVNGSGDRLLDVASTFRPTRDAAVIYNNPRRSYESLFFGEFSGSGDTGYTFGSNNTGSLIFTSLSTGSYNINASATEFQFIGGNEYNTIGTTPTQSFRCPDWLVLGGTPSVATAVQENSGQNMFLRGAMYDLHTMGAWHINQPLKYEYNESVVPMLVTGSYHYNSTAIRDSFIFTASEYNLSGTTSNYGSDVSVNFGTVPGVTGVTYVTADGSPGRGVTASLQITCEGGEITMVKINQQAKASSGWAFGDKITISQGALQTAFAGSGGGSGNGSVEIVFNDREAFATSSNANPSSRGEDLGLMIMKGPVGYFQNLLRRSDPSFNIFLSLQAPMWGAMNTWNHATITGSVSSGSQKNTGSLPYEYSDTGYAPIFMTNGDGGWSAFNHPYPFVFSTPRQEQVTETTVMTNGMTGRLFNQYNQFADIGDEGRANPLNYWQQNISASSLFNFEDQNNPFMVEVGDELRVSYVVEDKLFYENVETSQPKSKTIYTQDFTVVDFWQPAPSLITDFYSDSDVPAPGGKNQMCLTMSALPEKGVYSPEEIVKRYKRQIAEGNAGNNGGAVFVKGDEFGSSFTNQSSKGFGRITSADKLTSIADGDISGSVAVCVNLRFFPPSSSQGGMSNKHTYIIGTNQGLLDFGSGAMGLRSSSQAGGPTGDLLVEGPWNQNLNFALSGSLPILDYEQPSPPYFALNPDPAFAYDRLIVHPDPRKLEQLIPTGSIRSVTLRKRVETDNRVVLDMRQPSGQLGIQTPSGDGYIVPNDLTPQQLLNVKTLIKELKSKNIFRKDSDTNIK